MVIFYTMTSVRLGTLGCWYPIHCQLFSRFLDELARYGTFFTKNGKKIVAHTSTRYY